MTVQDKLSRIAKLKQEIGEIEEDIKNGKQLELDKFLDEAVGNYVRFTFDESDDVFLMVNERRSSILKGSGIVFYLNEGFETIENQCYTVDIDSDFKILKEDEWLTIVNNKTMSRIAYLCS